MWKHDAGGIINFFIGTVLFTFYYKMLKAIVRVD